MDTDTNIHYRNVDKRYEMVQVVMIPLLKNTMARQQCSMVTKTVAKQSLLTAEFHGNQIPNLTFNSGLDASFSQTVERKGFSAGSAVFTETETFIESHVSSKVMTFHSQQYCQAGSGGPTVAITVLIEIIPFNPLVQVFLQPVCVNTQTGFFVRPEPIELQQGSTFADSVVLSQNEVLYAELYGYY